MLGREIRKKYFEPKLKRNYTHFHTLKHVLVDPSCVCVCVDFKKCICIGKRRRSENGFPFSENETKEVFENSFIHNHNKYYTLGLSHFSLELKIFRQLPARGLWSKCHLQPCWSSTRCGALFSFQCRNRNLLPAFMSVTVPQMMTPRCRRKSNTGGTGIRDKNSKFNSIRTGFFMFKLTFHLWSKFSSKILRFKTIFCRNTP